MPGNDGDEIWTVYAGGVKPLKRGGKPASSRRSAKKPSTPRDAGEHGRGFAKTTQAQSVDFPVDFHAPLDHNLEKRLRQGIINIEVRLDLHGMYQDEAHKALERFIAAQVKAGRRYLLIITGKGRGGEGVLRTALGVWLAASAHSAHILALRPAAIRHGGGGAFYVLLKRRKD